MGLAGPLAATSHQCPNLSTATFKQLQLSCCPPVLNAQSLFNTGYRCPTPGVQPRALWGHLLLLPSPELSFQKSHRLFPVTTTLFPHHKHPEAGELFSWDSWIPLVVVQHQFELLISWAQLAEADSLKPGLESGRLERSASPKGALGVKKPSGKKRFNHLKPTDTKIMMATRQLFGIVLSGKQSRWECKPGFLCGAPEHEWMKQLHSCDFLFCNHF